ncbi:FAD-binding oxidoreductase [Streptomyces zagrosensis]|uniref:4-cresol dehydrogenase (Hydroxylating) n=1 Tax=Streptomyces zagrosensis TaxID=1042984 RepID=A0A7W9Q965_9ACTN|nr:FAD-binding oxidoreductase [Streptomyces zagrosensis]MBB5935458.1 4-cresol dehydrogenase (hydroxylating) [Streptomyces zagrosensis]
MSPNQRDEADQEKALAGWREILGAEGVLHTPAALAAVGRNTSAFPPRDVTAVLRPTQAAQIPDVVRVAREQQVPLHPVSTGLNWGLGSKLPVRPGSALLDLSGMNRIRYVDARGRFAVVEPGVTQKQLADHLAEHAPDLVTNVTGSSPNSSVMGNLLERGTGFRRHRAEEVRGLEVVLGTGELIRTGLWSGADARHSHHYRHGLGPGLDGLFVQSNLGIVTAAVVDLLPRREELRLLMFSFSEKVLPGVVDAVGALFTADILRSIVHFFNDKRILSMTASTQVPTWTGVVALDGTQAQVQVAVQEARGPLAAVGAAVREITAADAAGDEADPLITAMFDVHSGRPTTAFLQGLHQATGATTVPDAATLDALDDSTIGYLACMPVVAVEGATVRDLMATVERICAKHGIVPALAINPMNADYAESVINLYFDRTDPQQTASAHACNDDLHRQLYAEGFRFYRIGIDAMEFMTEQDTAPWGTIARLKAALDPDGVIAPGRYCPISG